MGKRLLIIIGKKYNKLTVIKSMGGGIFECNCECGVICNHSKKKSCGCQKIESARQLCIKRKTHGLSHTKEYTKIYGQRTREKHNVRIKETKKQAHQKLKTKVFSNYCDNEIICKHCGESDMQVLNLDHIDGGGRKQQKKVGGVYGYVVRNNFPSGYQVLCQNCNCVKLHINQEGKKKINAKNAHTYKKYNLKKRQKLINAYSNGLNCCAICNTSDIRVLCLDHIKGMVLKIEENIKAQADGGDIL